MAYVYTTLKKPNYARPPHLLQLNVFFATDGTKDAIVISDQTTAIATLKSDIDTILDGTSLTGSELTDTKANIAGKVDTYFPTEVSTTISAVMQTAYDSMIADLEATSDTDFAELDNRCAGTGVYPANKDGNTTSTDNKLCESCKGMGYLAETNTGVTTWDLTTTFNYS